MFIIKQERRNETKQKSELNDWTGTPGYDYFADWTGPRGLEKQFCELMAPICLYENRKIIDTIPTLYGQPCTLSWSSYKGY